jgi:serine/threonine protein kinase
MFNGYVVSKELGGGAYGAVYKVVKKTPVGENVRAIKHITIPTEKQYATICDWMGGDEQNINQYCTELLDKYIVTEIRTLNRLSEKNAPNIIRYYEDEIISRGPQHDIYILMEHLTSIPVYVSTEDVIVQDIVRMGLDVLTALELCHEEGIIRGDIREDNIFVDKTGIFKIATFGVARIVKDTLIAVNSIPTFLAPELNNEKDIYTNSADLYALGIVLYRLLNHGRNPFLPQFPIEYTPMDEDKAFKKRLGGEVPSNPEHGGSHIGAVILKAISNKDERYNTAREFYTALQSAMLITSPEVINTNIKKSTNPPPPVKVIVEEVKVKSEEEIRQERLYNLRQQAKHTTDIPAREQGVKKTGSDTPVSENTAAMTTRGIAGLFRRPNKDKANKKVAQTGKRNGNKIKATLILIVNGKQQKKIPINSDSDTFILGRARTHDDVKVDCCFEDDRNVSRLHASIGFRDSKYYLVDEQSRNGTFLNGEKIKQNTLVEIRSGDNIMIGQQEMIFEV